VNILILSQNYFPEPDPMHTLGAGLVNCGHQVNVITGFPNYPYGRIYPGYRQKLWQREEIDGVRVIRLPLYPDRSRSFIKRSLNYLSFPISASILGPILCGDADIMIVQSPPITLGIPAWIMSLVHRIPFVFMIQDMWPETLPATGMVSNPLILNALARLGMFAYSKASAITVISPGFKKNLEAKGVPSGKIHVFYNWAYEDEFSLAEPDTQLAEKMGLNGRFNILYAGNMGPAQGLHNVIEAASLLTDIKDLQFILMGSGIERDKLEKMAKERKLKNVKFLPRQPMKLMPSFYALVDAVMVHLIDDPLFEITVPGKTQSCLLSGKPVIVSVNGDAADLVVKAGAGLAVRAMDPIDLARGVRKLYAMSREERETMGSAGRRYYFQNLAPEVQIPKYEQLFYEVLARNQG